MKDAATPAIPWWSRQVTANTDWMAEGICSSVGGDLFFPEAGDSIAQPKKICSLCPVRSECLEYALNFPGIQGIWGGTSGTERRAIHKRRNQQAAA